MRKRIETARRLRRAQTDAERRLWRHLRNRLLGGYRFRRQVPLGRFVVDFVCMETRLVIELDGGHHSERRAEDEERSRYIARGGFRVLRFWNNDVLMRTTEVLERVLDACIRSGPHPGPLPRAGEGE